MAFIYGLYYFCIGCDKEYYQKSLEVPERCHKCRRLDVCITKLIHYPHLPNLDNPADRILVMENRMSYAIMALEKQMTQLREAFKAFLVTYTSLPKDGTEEPKNKLRGMQDNGRINSKGNQESRVRKLCGRDY